MAGELTATTGETIRRGDLVKMVDGMLYPANIDEPNIGAASETIRAGLWAVKPPGGYWQKLGPRLIPPAAR